MKNNKRLKSIIVAIDELINVKMEMYEREKSFDYRKSTELHESKYIPTVIKLESLLNELVIETQYSHHHKYTPPDL